MPFAVSFSMIGVCSTLIGLVRVALHLEPEFTTAVDDLLALDAVAFLTSGMLAYAATHSHHPGRIQRLHRWSEGLFLTGMCVIAAGCILLAFDIA